MAACQCIFIHPDDEKNSWLLGKKIQVPLFGFLVPVLSDDKVLADLGSGLVMCCTFGDLTDLLWYKEHKLEFKEAILQDGTMSALCGKYQGLKVKEARKAISEDLIAQGHMIKQEEFMHNVATHERCGMSMEITIKKQWFIDILSNKQKYIDAGNKIHWYPEHMKSRYLNWVENLEWDWCISRQRYFGVPFPVWYCKDCGSPIIAQESELPVNPLMVTTKNTCSCGCKETLNNNLLIPKDVIPEIDIMDTWATSSVTPLINLDWHDKDKFKKEMLPMSLRPNAHDIIRTWDFYTIVKSLYHEEKLPWENIMISGHVMASKNEKISKCKENSKMEPAEVINTYSADAVRLWAATGSLGNDIVFSEEEFKNGNKLINKLWNTAKFVIMHFEGFEKTDDSGNSVMLHPFNSKEEVDLFYMDQWMLESFHQMIGRYHKYMEKYEIGLALGEIEKFFWGFCDDYIEIIKNRVYKPEIYGEAARKSGLYVSYKVMLGILKCFAIYIPHITEEIYQGYFVQIEAVKSIHLSELGKMDAGSDKEAAERIIKNGKAALEVIFQLRRYKSVNNLSLKTELENVIVTVPDSVDITDTIVDIKATCACVNIRIVSGEEIIVEVQ